MSPLLPKVSLAINLAVLAALLLMITNPKNMLDEHLSSAELDAAPPTLVAMAQHVIRAQATFLVPLTYGATYLIVTDTAATLGFLMSSGLSFMLLLNHIQM
jgi:hypothetical protein